MSRTTLSPAKRGVAGLTAAALTLGTFGVLMAGTSSAVGPVITVTSAKVTNPDAKLLRTVPEVDAKGAYDGSGTAVHIVGSNFPATPTVAFDGRAATSVLRLSDTLIVAKAPAASATGTTDVPVDIVVGEDDSVPDANESADVTLAGGYTYKAAPIVDAARYSTDGKLLEITGSNLADAQSVQLGPLTIKLKPTQVTATKISAIRIPTALKKASYNVTVNSFWGSDTLDSSWSVRPLPKSMVSATPTATGKHVGVKFADSITPDTFVKITGASLGNVDSVTFGLAPATFVVSSDTELFVEVPAMALTQAQDPATPVKSNTVTVPVVVKNGTLAALKPLKFVYKIAPIVTGVSYDNAVVSGDVVAATSTVVTLTGENLLGAKLYFGVGGKALSPKSGSTATSAQYTMPSKGDSKLVLGTAYDLWVVSKGGNLNTGRKITVSGS